MPLMVTPRKVLPTSGVRPKSPTAEKPKKAADRRAPKSVREVDDKLRRLGPYPIVTGPYDADDYDSLTRRRLDWMAQRSLLLAQKHQLGQKTDNDALQARTTVEVSVDDSQGQKDARKNATRVRQSEAWRYKQLDGIQRQAEIEMGLALKSRTAGMGASSSKYGQVGGGNPAFDVSAAIDQTWREWAAAAPGRGIAIGATIDCIAEPKTLADIERDHGFKAGHALANFQRALDLWAELRGWTRRVHTIA